MKHPTSTPHLSCSSISLSLSAVRKGESSEARNIEAALVVQLSLPLPSRSQEVGKQRSTQHRRRTCRAAVPPSSFMPSGRGESSEARNVDAALVVQQSFPLLFCSQDMGKAVKHPTSMPHLSSNSLSLFPSAAREEGEAMKHPTSTPHLSCSCLPPFLSAVRKG